VLRWYLFLCLFCLLALTHALLIHRWSFKQLYLLNSIIPVIYYLYFPIYTLYSLLYFSSQSLEILRKIFIYSHGLVIYLHLFFYIFILGICNNLIDYYNFFSLPIADTCFIINSLSIVYNKNLTSFLYKNLYILKASTWGILICYYLFIVTGVEVYSVYSLFWSSIELYLFNSVTMCILLFYIFFSFFLYKKSILYIRNLQ
jgi:hypothetical protein